MKRSRFNKEQIIGILREAEAGSSTKAVCAALRQEASGGQLFDEDFVDGGLEGQAESLCLGHNLREKEMSKEKKDARCDDLIDALLEKHGISPEAVLGESGLIAQLKKRVVEKALAGELTHHLGYAKGEA